MARITRDREDLLREATALSPRIMLAMIVQSRPCEVFAGFRGAAVSIYFGAAPVYHFNTAGELRRAFVDDCLIKAEVGQLIRSTRERSAEQVVLTSKPLTLAETGRFLSDLQGRLAELRSHLNRGTFEVLGQVPEGGGALAQLQSWLENRTGLEIAKAANVN